MDTLNNVIVVSTLCISVFIAGCNSDQVIDLECPGVTDNISWDSYGSYDLDESGGESTAQQLLDNCEWHIYNDHYGINGDTLQVASRREDIVFVWKYNLFSSFTVQNNWDGYTSRGAYLGMHITDFHGQHPEFTPITEDLSQYIHGTARVMAYFEYGFLFKITVTPYFF